MLLSWLVVTNHCALGFWQTASGATGEHAHCHGSGTSGDSQKSPKDGMRECCRVIKANLASSTELKAAAPQFHLLAFLLLDVLAAPQENEAATFIHDHGPPRGFSFAESVLQRSLLSHAPPILA